MKKIAKAIIAILLLAVASLLIGGWFADEPRPIATPSETADIIAKSLLTAVNDSAWQQTGAISWTFKGARKHLWDRQRSLEQSAWGDYEVWIDLNTQKGVAKKNGTALSGKELDTVLNEAWKRWCNDSFWLNPVSKIFDEGTSRSLIEIDGEMHLLVSYSNGGVTPGDAYLWKLDSQGKPVSWKMWVSTIPIGGVHVSWEDWQQLSTGAWIAHNHQMFKGMLDLPITDVLADTSLLAITNGQDPFAVLYE